MPDCVYTKRYREMIFTSEDSMFIAKPFERLQLVIGPPNHTPDSLSIQLSIMRDPAICTVVCAAAFGANIGLGIYIFLIVADGRIWPGFCSV